MRITNLSNYIKKLPDRTTSKRREEINRIATECGVNVATVYRWINGSVIPPNKLTHQKLSELTGIPIESLFSEPDK